MKNKITEKSRQIYAEMRRLYEDEGMSIIEIAKIFGISRQAVFDRLKRADVKMRPRKKSVDRETLYRLYITEGLTISEISRRLDQGRDVINLEIARHEIAKTPRRARGLEYELLYQLYVVEQMSQNKIRAKLGRKVDNIREALKRHGFEIRRLPGTPAIHLEFETLYQVYITDGMTTTAVASKFGCSPKVVVRELCRHGIPRRSRAEIARNSHAKRRTAL